MAYFAAFGAEIAEDPAMIFTEDLQRHFQMLRLDQAWQKHVAALYFVVEPDKAIQLLLEPEVEESDSVRKSRTV